MVGMHLLQWTHRDAVVLLELELELMDELNRAQAKEEETQDDDGVRPH